MFLPSNRRYSLGCNYVEWLVVYFVRVQNLSKEFLRDCLSVNVILKKQIFLVQQKCVKSIKIKNKNHSKNPLHTKREGNSNFDMFVLNYIILVTLWHSVVILFQDIGRL